MDVKICSCFVRDAVASKVWGVCGWMLNLFAFRRVCRCFYGLGVCGWMLNLFVFPSGVSLLLRFGGVWVDIKFVCFSFGCVVASKVWGCVGGC